MFVILVMGAKNLLSLGLGLILAGGLMMAEERLEEDYYKNLEKAHAQDRP